MGRRPRWPVRPWAPRVLALLAACLLAASPAAASARPSAQVAPAPAQRVSQQVVQPAQQARTVAQDEQAFALQLLSRLGPGSPDLVLSPSSIAALLAMLEPGAAGTTQSGIAQALQSLGLGPLDQASGWRALEASLTSQSAHDHIAFELANETWLQDGFPLRPAYLQLLATEFHSGVQEADFRGDPFAAARAVDAWVAAHTGGHITQLVTPAELRHVAALLVDAVYMDAAWATPFDASLTAPAPFRTPSATVQVPTMQTPSPFAAPASSAPSLEAVQLAYEGGQFSALVLMPPLSELSMFEKSLTPLRLSQLVAALRYQPVTVSMPRFRLNSALMLNNVLSAMGMSQAFTPAADFSNMSPKSLQLSFVVHDAQMTVAEKGTEASAATAGGAVPTAVAPLPHLQLDFDHPFLFLVRDDTTGLVMFAAQVSDPRG